LRSNLDLRNKAALFTQSQKLMSKQVSRLSFFLLGRLPA